MAYNSKHDFVLKLVVTGDENCGKLTMMDTFVYGKDKVGASGRLSDRLVMKTIDLDGKRIRLVIRKPLTKYQKLVLDPVASCYRGCQGVLLVYDITNSDSLEHIRYRMNTVEMEAGEDVKMMIVGNKCDKREERQVSHEGMELAESCGIKFMEVSAKMAINIEEAFHTLVRDILGDKLKQTDNEMELKQDKEIVDVKQSSLIRRIIDPILGTFQGKSSVPDEIQLDPYAVELYQKALKDGIEKDRFIRVNIVGNYKQGKTSLTRRLLGQKVRGIRSTNGIDIEHYTFSHTADGRISYQKVNETNQGIVERLISVALNNEITATIDTNSPTHHQQQSSDPVWQGSSHSTMTDKPRATQSVNTITQQIGTVKQDSVRSIKSSPEPDHPVASNYKSKKVTGLSQREIGEFAKALKNKMPQSEINMPTTFDVWDFGGQYIFYATHSIFHTKRAIYLLVFDLSLGLDSVVLDDDFPFESSPKNMKYFLQFWMQSIHSFVGSADGSEPKVILVGTHKDKVKGNAEQRKRYIEQYFNNVRQLFDGTDILNHIHPEDFAVDNNDAKDASVVALRRTIARLGKEETNVFEIPAKWIHLEKSLRERKHLKIISLKFVMAVDSENEFPLGGLEETKLFLRYHHGKGTFVYFDEDPISEYVVLDPQHLVDAFKSIITSERFCTNDPQIRPLWRKLITEARLEREVIDRQWGSVENKEKLFFQNKDILVSFLTKHRIISEAATFDEATHTSTGLGWYVVPSLLRDHSQNAEIQEFLEGKQQTSTRLVISFGSTSIVSTVYHRQVSALIARWPVVQTGKRHLIFTNLCVVRLNVYHAGIAEMKQNNIELTVASLCPSYQVDGEQADNFRRFSEAVIAHEFGKLRDRQNTVKPYTLMYRCNHTSHGIVGGVEMKPIEDLDGQKLVPCPDLLTHELIGKQVKSEWFQDSKTPINAPKQLLNDKLLSRFARCIGENWQLMGFELGLKQAQIEHIVEEHPHSTSMKIYYMLKTWCLKMADAATVDVLVKVLQDCSNLTVEWDELRNIVDEIK